MSEPKPSEAYFIPIPDSEPPAEFVRLVTCPRCGMILGSVIREGTALHLRIGFMRVQMVLGACACGAKFAWNAPQAG